MSRLALLATALLGGCSFVSMNGPPKTDPPGVYPVCSDRVAPWVFDSLAATGASLATLSAAAGQGEPSITVGIGAGAATLVASAVYGAVTRTRCRASRSRYVAPPPAYRLDAAEPLRVPSRLVAPKAPVPARPAAPPPSPNAAPELPLPYSPPALPPPGNP